MKESLFLIFVWLIWTRTIDGSILQTLSIHRVQLGKIQPFIVDHSSIKGRLNEMTNSFHAKRGNYQNVGNPTITSVKRSF